MNHTITRRLEFDAGHRVYQHEAKCSHLHGHRYVVELECTADLDSLGRVIDFSILKSLCGQWIDTNLDHGMILFNKDPLVEFWKSEFNFSGYQKYYLMDKNPTAENLAEHLYDVFSEMLSTHGVMVTSVTVHETPNCKAVYRR